MATACTLGFDQGTLVLGGVVAEVMEKLFPRGLWVLDRRIGAFRCDAVEYASVRETLRRKLAGRVVDSVPRWVGVEYGRGGGGGTGAGPVLRADQLAAVSA